MMLTGFIQSTQKIFCIINSKKSVNSIEFSWPTDYAKKELKILYNKINIGENDIHAVSYNFDPTGNKKGILYSKKSQI